MLEAIADLWEYPADARVITTNGEIIVGNDCVSRVVMGAGCAKEARDRYPGLDNWLALRLNDLGNVPIVIMNLNELGYLVTLPTKNYWREKSNLGFIRIQLQKLVELVDKEGYQRVVMPRPGCGFGGLSWYTVKKEIESMLDDRFTVVDKP